MTTLQTPAADAISADVQSAFERLTGQVRMPPLYRQIGNSLPALGAYLNLEQALVDGALSAIDAETIKLIVSVHNRCGFCLKTHRAKALAAGLDASTVESICTGGHLSDARVAAIYAACTQLLGGNELDSEARHALETVGFDQAGLVDIALAMAAISFTNWFNHINHTPA